MVTPGRGEAKARVGDGGRGRVRGRGRSGRRRGETPQPMSTSPPRQLAIIIPPELSGRRGWGPQPVTTSPPLQSTIPPERSVSTMEPPAEMHIREMAISAPKTVGLPVSMPETSAPMPKTYYRPFFPGGEGRKDDYQFGSVILDSLNEFEGGKNAPGSSQKNNVSPSDILLGGGGKNDLVPMNRPDRGGKNAIGGAVKLLVNHFQVTFDEGKDIFHYDLDITKAINSDVHIKNREDCVKIKNELLRQHAASFGNAAIVHDGKRNIYSIKPLGSLEPLGPGEESYTVSIHEGGAAKEYTVTVKCAAIKDGNALRNFLNVDNQHHVNFKEFQDYLQCLDLVIREDPSQNKLLVGRSLYPNQNSPNEYRKLGYGAIEADGFYQSLRPTAKGLVLIVDLSVGTFYESVPVIEYLKNSVFVDCQGSGPLSELPQRRKILSKEQRSDVEKALKGLKIRVTHRNGGSRKYTIRGLSVQITTEIEFNERSNDINGPGKMVRLVDFFQDEYGHKIVYLQLPCLDLGRSRDGLNYVPMELCELCEGQRFRQDKDKNRRQISCKLPRIKFTQINEIVKREYATATAMCPTASHFQLTVNANMIKVTGRQLQAPKLWLKKRSNEDEQVDPGKPDPNWSLDNRHVFQGKGIENWCTLNFSNGGWTKQKPVVEHFERVLGDRCRDLGIEMNRRPLQLSVQQPMNSFNDVEALRLILRNVRSKAKNVDSLIVICIMEKKHSGYNTLKFIAETEIGLVTQCCLFQKIKKYQSAFLGNLALKMNAKMGGMNFSLCEGTSLQLQRPGKSQVMYIGADVNHPNPGDNDSPSVAAVVGSINWPWSNRYIAKIRYQTHRNEQIEKLTDMTKELLHDYHENNKGQLPGRILFFRDGVSESQFDMVLNKELLALKEAVDQIKFKHKDYHPLISIIVAQKRHHTRLFHYKEPSGDIENVPAGTVVDTGIVHPRQFDFYLCSHYGRLGTSRPTHYHVLMDESKFTSDDLQKLINNLCYTFARCTRPVSLVPPVFYADLAAYRGRCYLHTGLPPSTARTEASTSSAAPSTQNVNDPGIMKPVNERMFFC